MDANVLTLNGGSSSLKAAVYRLSSAGEQPIVTGAAEAIGASQGRIWLRDQGDKVLDRAEIFPTHSSAIQSMFIALREQGISKLEAAGHRIVHGGPYFHEPRRIDSALLKKLNDLIVFAPLHLPAQVALIQGVADHYPDLPQVACFDTAFHSEMPDIARRFPLPERLWEEGVMRYGFHGLSYEYIVASLGSRLGSRAVIAHLGNGASMVALKDGRSIDTSMGMTPTGGFMMGTRTGDLDPGVLLFLLRKGWTQQHIAELVDRESGLLGVSGISSDMKKLLEESSRQPPAAQAIAMFCYQIRKFIGAYAAALGGLDQLVFTGGIGERAVEVRAEIARGLDFVGIELDQAANSANAEIISAPQSRCSVRVVRTDEDLMIARHTRRLLGI
jgi:acetate kinase